MKIEGEHIFKGPRQAVWEMFMDPAVLASALPGTQKLNKVSETEYDGEIFVRVGPVSGAFSGRLVMSNVKPPESCTLTAEGKGSPGFVKGSGDVQFADSVDHTTQLKYTGDVQIGGTLASVGQRMIDSVSKSMIRQGFEALDRALEARLAAGEGQAVEYKPTTETEFATGVTKDIFKNAMQIAEVRMLLYVVPIALFLALLVFIITKLEGH